MAYKNVKREKLLEAIDVLFLQKGSDAVTISDVARLAGVPLGNVYYYFKKKIEMLKEALKSRDQQIKESLINIEKENKNPKSQLQSFIYLFFSTKSQEDNRPCLGKFIVTILLDLEKSKNVEIYEYFSHTINYLFTWCSSKFIEQGNSIKDSESYAAKLITTLTGACIFNPNSPIKFSDDITLEEYIKFIIKVFDLETNDKGIVTSISDWKK
jgi:TetR/AcrR family transcriptional regulator, transcriptional repressor for nem operon